MGVSDTINRQTYACDGSSTIFNFPHYFFNPADLAVYLFDTGSSIVTPQVLNTNYTVGGAVNAQGVYPNGGTVIMNCAGPTSLQLVVTRNPSPIQVYSLLQNGNLNATALVQQFDYLTTLVQRLQDEVSRCIQLPDGLGTIGGNNFSTSLPQTIILQSSAYAPLIVNSGATGITTGFTITSASSISGFSGVLPVPNGGTGISSFPAGGLLYATTATQFSGIASASIATPATVMIRDGNGNAAQANALSGQTSTVSAGTTTTLTVASNRLQQLTGTLTQTYKLPDATTLALGTQFELNNNSTGIMTVQDNASGAVCTVPAGGYVTVTVTNIGSAAGVWDKHFLLPANASYGNTGLNLSTGSSVTGVLPLVNGGTGVSSFVNSFGVLVASSATQVATIPPGAAGQALIANASSFPTFQNVAVTTNVATKTAAYNVQTTDDVIYVGSGCNILNLYGGAAAPKFLSIIKNFNSLDQCIINGSSNSVAGQSSITVATQLESWRLFYDGTVWQKTDHFAKTPPTSFNLTIGGTSVTPTIGSSTIKANWWRDGQFYNAEVFITQSSAGGAVSGTGAYTFQNPTGIAADSSRVSMLASNVTGAGAGYSVGYGTLFGSAGPKVDAAFPCLYDPSTLVIYNTGNAAFWGSAFAAFAANAQITASFQVRFPVSGWQP